ncbi:hypothetical protein BN8_03012 [Fibrisoma limi BUZ 3]|uniref:Uncharacterized protein n=1 Tax=Fibrisoma limi BUZ 3 TaxID=1185876 RepID=I2GJ05_9BACT|nr:hypothetical protein BN8_03012 [Fibrisoma limi BUZ 3]
MRPVLASLRWERHWLQQLTCPVIQIREDTSVEQRVTNVMRAISKLAS